MQRKRKLRQFHKEENRGSAMIVAIVVSMVVVVFCLSLLLVSYALFSSSVRRVTQNQCRELSKTISIEIEKELTTPAYTSFDMQKQDVTDGKNLLWQYLRYNVCQGNWPYYESESSTDHGEKRRTGILPSQQQAEIRQNMQRWRMIFQSVSIGRTMAVIRYRKTMLSFVSK